MNRMGRKLLLTALTFILSIDRRFSGNAVPAIFNESVTLTMNEKCTGTVHLRTGNNKVNVAERIDGVWVAAEGYAGRIQHRSVTSVNLTNVGYNDEGLYEFNCGEHVVSRIPLTVLPTVDILLPARTVQIQLHSSVARPAGWHRDGEQFTEGPLVFNSSSLEHQGKFTGHDGKTAVRVFVEVRDPHQTTGTSSPSTQGADEKNGMGPGLIVSVTLNVLFIIAAAVFFTLWRVTVKQVRRLRQADQLHGAERGVGASGGHELAPYTDRNPAECRVNGDGPSSQRHNGCS